MPGIHQLHPTEEQLAYSFGGHEPLLRVAAGSVVELSTEDCFRGNVRTVEDLPSQVCTFPFLNPVTGPIAVEGAEPGDALAVHFADIRPARDWAVSSTFPHFGALTTTGTTPDAPRRAGRGRSPAPLEGPARAHRAERHTEGAVCRSARARCQSGLSSAVCSATFALQRQAREAAAWR